MRFKDFCQSTHINLACEVQNGKVLKQCFSRKSCFFIWKESIKAFFRGSVSSPVSLFSCCFCSLFASCGREKQSGVFCCLSGSGVSPAESADFFIRAAAGGTIPGKKRFFFHFGVEKKQKMNKLKGTKITARWCNGSTTDSGSVCLGSSPGRAAIFLNPVSDCAAAFTSPHFLQPDRKTIRDGPPGKRVPPAVCADRRIRRSTPPARLRDEGVRLPPAMSGSLP